MEFRLQLRKFSTNIIEKKIVNEEGKESWTPYLSPLVTKTEGDELCDKILLFLNSSK
jgi:hypothetical protein|tara:strand:+ start:320 stop:490 length:171 start_codon:yes stop_codon:yes gene_type:complete